MTTSSDSSRPVEAGALRAENQALRARERELSQIIDLVPSHVWRLTPDGEPTFFNRRMVDYLGMDVADTDGRGTSRLEVVIGTVHPDDAGKFRDALHRSLATGELFAMRYRLRSVDGSYHWMSSRAEPLRDESGRIVQWYGICHDIDDQVKAEEALRRSERHVQQIIDTLPIQLWSWTPAGELTYANKRYLDSVGVQTRDFQEFARVATELLHPDDAPEVRRRATECMTKGEIYVGRYRRRSQNAGYRWLQGRFEPQRDENGQIQEWFALAVDIDDEVRTQETLRDREQELAQLVDMVPSYTWRLSPEGEPNFLNRRLIEFFGVGIEDSDSPDKSRLASMILAFVHPDDAPGVEAAFARSIATGERLARKYRLRRADGVYRWMDVSAEPMRDEHGVIVQWYGLCHDIDDQVRAQEALRESERSFRELVDTLPAMIDCAAPNGEPVYRSQRLRQFLGYDLEELDATGKSRLAGTLDAGVHPDDLEGVKERYAHSLATGEPYARTHRLRRYDGEYLWMETRAAPMRNAEGTIVQWNVICLDIDREVRAREELRLAQESLVRASQAASLAELSASIAHEVNQPLAAVVANSHACQRWLTAEPPSIERAQKTVERIVRDANSAADVVSRIRALFRQETVTRSDTTIESVVAEARDLMADEAVRRRVRLLVEVEPDLPRVALDSVQIKQVLINLMRNGIEAMDDVAIDRSLGVRVRRADGQVRVEVRDRGAGVTSPDEVFQPFYTTKDQGMGMGLAICRSIVESHGGRLWVENNDPVGATFVFTLPQN